MSRDAGWKYRHSHPQQAPPDVDPGQKPGLGERVNDHRTKGHVIDRFALRSNTGCLQAEIL